LTELRGAGHFQWHVINALAFVLYVYASAIRRGEWSRVALGVGFLAVELVWEMANALVLHFSGRAALWMIGGRSAYLIYAGINIEIALMFAVAPLVLFQLLPADRSRRVLGLPNRLVIPAALGGFCVAVECLLNRLGALVWSWPFWRWPHIELIVLAYSLPFIALAWLHDHVSLRNQVRGAVVAVGLAAGLHLLLAVRLGWI
jgi:hypothetical protein